MHDRFRLRALLLIALALPFAGCTNALVDSLAISPSLQSLTVGQTTQFTATGTIGHGDGHPSTTQDDTDSVTWISSSPSVATVNSTGMATAVASGSTTITATMNGYTGVISASATLTVTATTTSSEPIVSLTITPGSQSLLEIDQSVQFIAIATTASGATVNLTNQTAKVGTATINAAVWTSSVPAVGTISAATGVATSVGPGTTTITAMATNPDGTVVTGTATLAVTPTTSSSEPIVSLAIVPAAQTLTSANQTAGFIVIGTTGSGTTVNLTDESATVGTSIIKAAVWTSSVPSVASINSATGVATALTNGATAITAVATNPDGTAVTGTATLTVSIAGSPEPIASLAIVPSSETLTISGQTAGFIVIGTTGTGATVNLTNQTATVGTSTIKAAVWSSSIPSVAGINAATGVATAGTNGTTAITAVVSNPDGTVVTGAATLTVTIPATREPIVSLAIVPASQTLTTNNQTAGFIAVGTTDTGATVNVTNQSVAVGAATINAAVWISTVPSVASINSATGVATAAANGVTVITAQVTNPDGTVVTGSATVTVTNASTAEFSALTIVPGSQTVTVSGQTAQFIALATSSATGLEMDVTNSPLLKWGSSVSAVATITSQLPTGNGLATTTGVGTTSITAELTNPGGSAISATASLTVTAPATSVSSDITSVIVIPATQSVASPGQMAQFIPFGITSTGATVNLTGLVTWNTSSRQIATVSGSGLADAVSQGTATISALYSNLDGTSASGTATFTVTGGGGTNGDITSINIIPGTQSVAAPGGIATFIPIGITASGASVNLTGAVTWNTSSSQIATVTPVSNGGQVAAIGQGTATISALYTNSDSTVATGSASFQVLGASSSLVTAITIFPGSQAVTALSTQNQYTALATEGGAQYDVTDQVVWSSSDGAVASVGTPGDGIPGMVKAVGVGSATIFATYTNTNNSEVVGQASYSVSAGSSPEPLLSINIVPAGTTVSTQTMTGQYLAFGNYSAPPLVRDITDEVTWISLLPDVASINSGGTPGEVAGLATALGYTGSTVIYAEDTTSNPDHTLVLSNSQIFTCKDPNTNVCDPGPATPQVVTVSVFIYGENTSPTGEFVTAPSDTNTPNLIHCGPDYAGAGGQVCTGTYAYSATATLKLTENLPAASAFFGGWSSGSGCSEANPETSTTCTIPLTGNASVGVIFY